MPFNFAHVCDLLQRLESFELQEIALTSRQKSVQYHDEITQWFKAHRRQFDAPDTDAVALLSSLLPEHRTDRVYGLQESSLVKVLARSLGLGRERLRLLCEWKSTDRQDLATCVCRIQSATDAGMPRLFVTVEEIDSALNMIAAYCRFSSPTIRALAGGKSAVRPWDILNPILRRLPSRDLKWFIRLVLKRYDPVTLDDQLILRSFHFLLPALLKFQSNFTAACSVLKGTSFIYIPAQPEPQCEDALMKLAAQHIKPQLGVKIGRPTFLKARSIKHCLDLMGAERWTVEPKYDGEYCQLHVDLSKSQDCIQLFSKSGKDSTRDRARLHGWIRKCLRIGKADCRFKQRCILAGEMVAYDDRNSSILEFSKIRKQVTRSGSFIGTEMDSPLRSHEHLMIVFFDALVIDDDVVMSRSYPERRQRLKEILFHCPGPAPTTEWGTLDLSKLSRSRATRTLERLFSKSIASRCEGLILKPCDGPYFQLGPTKGGQSGGSVIKLKKDYIPGLGDNADFAIVGANHNVAQALKTGQNNSKWTNFIIACLYNKEKVLRFQEKPHFKVVGALGRPCISVEDINYICTVGQFNVDDIQNSRSSCTFAIDMDEHDPPMSVVFKKPFVVELLGSGFERPSSRDYYMLRHPRVVKIHKDRMYKDIVSFDELQELAKKALSIPDDLKQDEIQWLRRLQYAGQPKRSKYVDDTSPFSEAVSQSPVSCKTSPRRSPLKKVPVPMVRIDSVELLPNERRFTSNHATISRLCVSEKRSPLPTPSKSSVSMNIEIEETSSVPDKLEGCEVRKRKVDDNTIQSPGQNPTKRRKYATITGKQQKDSVSVTKNASETCRISTLALKRPLADITNSPPKQAPQAVLQRSSNSTDKSEIGFCQTAEQDGWKAALQDLDIHKMERRTSALRIEVIEVASLVRKNSKDQQPSLTFSEDSSSSYHTACSDVEMFERPWSTIPKVQSITTSVVLATKNPIHLSHPSPFQWHTFYLAPYIANVPYFKERLLPILNAQCTPATLAHWMRDVRPELTRYDAIVSESQAFLGLQKAVLIDSIEEEQISDVMAHIMQLRLAAGEVVEIWDCLVAETLNETTPRSNIQTWMAEKLADSFIGWVDYDADAQANVYHRARRKEKHAIASKWVTKAFEDAE